MTPLHNHCEDEHHDHSHSAPLPTNAQQSLYEWIDTPKLRCLNVVRKGNANSVVSCFIKSQDEKYDISRYIESDADCQMLIHIPFTSTCRVFSLILRGGRDSEMGTSSIRNIKIYNNYNKNLDFDTIQDSKPQSKFEYPQDVGVHLKCETAGQTEEFSDSTFVEHHLPRHIFQNSHSVTIFVQDTWSGDEDDSTKLCYLELRGESTGISPTTEVPLLKTVYEATPNPKEHAKLEPETDPYQMTM
ncbi:PITH domain-containing protein Ecym_7338 [Eremothecium cymbalariae DBVPG|uniref:PITH domain-containing protein n=1 Tax=Eremothecium cymbalariae (strain CBS 270.75 / DBVPG 7215 / KCTC 17166 / NRRL Y-17582) TaxID=931890 RepID=G8JWF3_ERECY|nr:hypothetical protein Ecym_7338 [Eremothecium cymbalariae DBVPG\